MSKSLSQEPISVGRLFCERTPAGFSRVSAMVGKDLLWFETADAQLDPTPEGYASALLVPAMSHGRDLVFDDPLCPVWLRNAQELMGHFSRWWGWAPIRIVAEPADKPRTHKSPGRALCFSGGVDSFYSLLTYPRPIDQLVLVHDYDLRLEDEEGARIAFDHVRQVASAKGLAATMIRTNYREHPLAGRKYMHAYLGALAGVGHLLSGIGELVVSSSYRYDEAKPNGSHWQTDPLWSSAALQVVHYGADLIRDDKLRAILSEPLLKRHLRVCQQNYYGKFEITEQHLNCGTCQKCIRTLLVFGQEVGLDGLDIFRNRENLGTFLYNETYVGEYLYKAYHEICSRGVDKECELSIDALIRRSVIMNRTEFAGRRLNKVLYRLLRTYDLVEKKLRL